MTPGATISSGGLVIGLDKLSIEPYTKIVVGESKHLPEHEAAACSILLSVYNANEIVRCMRECRHCLHEDSIGGWPQMQGHARFAGIRLVKLIYHICKY